MFWVSHFASGILASHFSQSLLWALRQTLTLVFHMAMILNSHECLESGICTPSFSPWGLRQNGWNQWVYSFAASVWRYTIVSDHPWQNEYGLTSNHSFFPLKPPPLPPFSCPTSLSCCPSSFNFPLFSHVVGSLLSPLDHVIPSKLKSSLDRVLSCTSACKTFFTCSCWIYSRIVQPHCRAKPIEL